MKEDEELGLYDIFNDEKKQGVKELIDKHILEEASWKFNPLKKLDGEFLRHAFKEGAKWQQERMYNEEEVYNLLCKLPNYFNMTIPQQAKARKEWFEQSKKK